MSLIVVAALLLSTVVYANNFSRSGKAAGVTTRGGGCAASNLTFVKDEPDSNSQFAGGLPHVGDGAVLTFKLQDANGNGIANQRVSLERESLTYDQQDTCKCNPVESGQHFGYEKCPVPAQPVAPNEPLGDRLTNNDGLVQFNVKYNEAAWYPFRAKFSNPDSSYCDAVTKVIIRVFPYRLWIDAGFQGCCHGKYDKGEDIPGIGHVWWQGCFHPGDEFSFAGTVNAYANLDKGEGKVPWGNGIVHLYQSHAYDTDFAKGWVVSFTTTTDKDGHFKFEHLHADFDVGESKCQNSFYYWIQTETGKGIACDGMFYGIQVFSEAGTGCIRLVDWCTC